MRFAELFDVFSKRHASEPQTPPPLTQTFRMRVLMRCRDLFAVRSTQFWTEVHSHLAYLHGRPQLTGVVTQSPAEDAVAFLHNCDDAHFLDFIEYAFRTQAYFQVSAQGNVVDDINLFLRQDDLPYALTEFVWTKGTDDRGYQTSTLTRYPQVIRKDSEVLYETAIQPTLQLLRQPEFVAANAEFLEALEDFRKSDYGDCLTKCGSAFESVLKVICARRNWGCGPRDTASPLLNTVIARAGLPGFLEQPLIVIATLRNRLSKAHGAGTTPRAPTAALAEFAINATAAAILLLVKEAG